MKRYELKPRPCSCNGTCEKCDSMVKPYEFDTPRIFENRKHCCMFCPVLKAKKKTYRHTKKQPAPTEPTSVDLFLMGKLPTPSRA